MATDEQIDRREALLAALVEGADLVALAAGEGLTVAQVRRLVEQALTARGIPARIGFDTRLEVVRIDRMIAYMWRFASYDQKVVGEVRALQERRESIMRPSRYAHPLREAYDRAVESSGKIKPDVDAAIVAAGRTIADRVDEATATGQGVEVTKALYLIPHMVNVLRELEATPAARTAAAKEGGEAKPAGGRLAGMRTRSPALRVAGGTDVD